MTLKITFVSANSIINDFEEEEQTATLELKKSIVLFGDYEYLDLKELCKNLFLQQYSNHPLNKLGYPNIYIKKIEAII